MSARALFVGDVSLDLTMVVDHIPAPDEKVHVTSSHESCGGVVANAAVACCRAGAPVRLLLCTGDDVAGEVVRQALGAEGIGLEVEIVTGRTCFVVVLLEPHGEKRLLLDPGVSMYPSEAQVDGVDLKGVGWVHTAAYGAAAGRLSARCRTADVPWSLDLEPASFATGLNSLSSLVAGSELVFCNDRAARQIGPKPEATLFSMGAKAVLRTLGAAGARFVAADGTSASAQSPVRPVVRDTTGAGDCLAGWFIAERLLGGTPEAALQRAVAAAALSCEQAGAQTSYPTPEALREFLGRTDAPTATI